MRKNIHPTYRTTTVNCSCGNSFETGGTAETLSIEMCNECHPFYTGKQRMVDSGGRVDRFKRRLAKAQG